MRYLLPSDGAWIHWDRRPLVTTRRVRDLCGIDPQNAAGHRRNRCIRSFRRPVVWPPCWPRLAWTPAGDAPQRAVDRRRRDAVARRELHLRQPFGAEPLGLFDLRARERARLP